MTKPDADATRQRILDAQKAGKGATILEYIKLSGPGWLQSAITLGGGSLAGSLYLGIIGGYEMMWLQPLMMIFGIVMLSAIAQVALTTGEKPLHALNSHVSPVLGWGWVVATLLANLVWAMPQFSLGTAAIQQNLGILTGEGGEYIIALLLFATAAIIVWMYDKGGVAYKIFDILLKLMVASVVVSFFLVVFMMTTSGAGLPWGDIFKGFIPNPNLIFEPTESLSQFVKNSSAPDYWKATVVSAQRDRMVAAAATAVGINMTFLLPYSMLKRGWDKHFTGLAKFDLGTGLFVPFLLATSCVVIAASSQFHAKPEEGLIEYHQPETAAEDKKKVSPKIVQEYEKKLNAMLKATKSKKTFAELPEADRILAATLIERDAFALANSLDKLSKPKDADKQEGAAKQKGFSQVLFGIGVVGMAISTIIILMLINGFTVCEMLDRPSTGLLYRIGSFLPGITGALGALFLWSGKAKFYLAVPTSRFGMVLLPIAYIAFFCLMNSPRLLGDAMPRGGKRIAWNVLMGIGVVLALIGAAISILNDKAMIPNTNIAVKHIALGLVAALVIAAAAIHFMRKSNKD